MKGALAEPQPAGARNPKNEITIDFSCLPCWNDQEDGLPPFCRHTFETDTPGDELPCWKVFHPANKYTNDNLFLILLGNIGFKYFGERRRYFVGAAMWSTFISIAFTIAGCCALSTDPRVVRNVYWTYVKARDQTTNVQFNVYVGLQSLVYEHGPCDPLSCRVDTVVYTSNPADMKWPDSDGGYIEHAIAGCVDAAYSYTFGAGMTCFTLIFALMGTINRMKYPPPPLFRDVCPTLNGHNVPGWLTTEMRS
jgi:hypothetical protein